MCPCCVPVWPYCDAMQDDSGMDYGRFEEIVDYHMGKMKKELQRETT